MGRLHRSCFMMCKEMSGELDATERFADIGDIVDDVIEQTMTQCANLILS
jgi:hypothetical protein